MQKEKHGTLIKEYEQRKKEEKAKVEKECEEFKERMRADIKIKEHDNAKERLKRRIRKRGYDDLEKIVKQRLEDDGHYEPVLRKIRVELTEDNYQKKISYYIEMPFSSYEFEYCYACNT